jgi:hypothetical protein
MNTLYLMLKCIVVSTLALFSGGLGFEFQPRMQLSLPAEVFHGFSQLHQKYIEDSTFKLQSFPSISFPIKHV